MRNNTTTAAVGKQQDKIAIVGIACRFPGGVMSLDDYWRVLSEGQDVVTEIGEERFGTEFYQHPNRKEPGKSVTFAAGVLSDVEHFDASFFGISPREAAQMDPQQRLLLELAWEALENGGQVPDQLAGSDCAVYVGIASTDYLNRRVEDPASMDAYTMTGNTASVASNRISYVFDLQGPSVSVDTACSSSLVAVHHACQAILNGDASAAIAGGVNMLLHPFAFVGFSQASMLSERGRCRTFDANGDGYVRSEGAAVLFLKSLAQAEADGDPIHGVIVGTGINADGKTSSLTVPSFNQQGKLLRKVYAQAAVDVNDLVYLEAHGTGTAVGDPIETRAIGEVLGQARSKNKPLPIGSAKSNVGHLETASGMAGLLKALLTLKHQALPPSLHIETLNPKIDFAHYNLEVVTRFTPLEQTGARQLVGINSFGFGGGNAHVLIEHYQPVQVQQAASSVPAADATAALCPPLVLSARNEAALQAMAAQYADLLADETQSCYDIAWSLLQHRQQLPQGLVIKADNRAQLLEVLRTCAQGELDNTHVTDGQLLATATPLAWVFSGNGSQWQGMGRLLLEHSPVFRVAVQEVDTLLSAYVDYSLLDEFAATAESSRLSLTELAQPLLFALQVGVVRVLESLGVRPHATIGHSVGEVAAAWAAGALSLEQAVQVIYYRSHAQGKTRGQGRMAAVGLGLAAIQAKLSALDLQGRVEIAGVNSPNAVTLSGALADLESLQDALGEDGTFYRILDLDYAFHSHWMEPIREELVATLADLRPVDSATGVRFISTVQGKAMAGSALNADYWWHNIREPVAFEAGMNTLLAEGVQVFMEIGPHPILRSYINECLRGKEVGGQVLATGKRKGEHASDLQHAAFSAYLSGCRLDWQSFFPQVGRYVPLPNYPWQRERYWYPLTTEGYDTVNRRRIHPLLGYRLKDAEAMWENQLDTAKLPYLADHVVDGLVVVPAAAYVEMALFASAEWYKTATHTLENFEIRAPIVLDDGHAKTIRLNLLAADGSFTISSRDRLSADAWTVNVVGRITGAALKEVASVDAPDLDAVKAAAVEVLSAEQHYALTEAVGLSYLPAFQGVAKVWAQVGGALAALRKPAAIMAGFEAHILHPTLLDAGFQVLVDVYREDIRKGKLAALIPIQIGKLTCFAAHGDVAYLQLKIRKRSSRSVVADFLLLDAAGGVLAELQACRFRGVQFARTRQAEPGAYEFIPYLKPLPSVAGEASRVEAGLALELPRLLAVAAEYLQAREVRLQRAQHFQQIAPLFEVLATAFVWETVQQLCGELTRDISLQTLQVRQGIKAAQQPLLQRLFELLEEDGLAEQSGGLWQLADDAELPGAQDIWLAILGDSPAHTPELVMLGRCGQHLLPVLQGKVAADTLLNPAKSSVQDHWLDTSPSFRALNLALGAVVAELSRQWPTNRRLRILELGGGNGGLTHLLQPLLPAGRYDYVFTDTAIDKVTQAVDEFADYPFLQAQVLAADLNGDSWQTLAQQEGFDLIVAGHALYDWGDVQSVLPRLRALLKTQGLLLLAHAQNSRFFDLTQGLREDWWLPVDDASGHHFVARLHAPDEWQQALQASGFTAVQTAFEPATQDDEVGAFLMLAQADSSTAELGAAPATLPAQSWLIIADEQGFSAELASMLQTGLQAHGQQAMIQTDFAVTAPVEHILHLAGLSVANEQSVDLMATQERRCFDTLGLVQALDKQPIPAKLWLVTAGALPPAIRPVEPQIELQANMQPSQAPLWGLGRVLMNEHPDLACTLIDWQGKPSVRECAAGVLSECLQVVSGKGDGEDEILLTADSRHVLRLHKTQVAGAPQPVVQAPAVCLDFTTPGALKHLYWRALPEQTLQPDEIEILPKATGLNFRDVMYAMGLLSDEAVENGFAGASLGMELSGTVVRAGSAVQGFKPGDAVIGFAPACFSTRVITRTTAVAHKPAVWTDEEAATIPTTFFTVYYALQHLAQLQAGERILIHGASGGVGLAAIQFARYRGAEVFATAGTDEKREFVRLLGADHVLDSRNLRFAEDILRLTAGQGVDVVLNSISGEAINKNLSILRPFGRFLELGKRDFYENNKIGLRPFRNNISYFGIDADQLLIERPELAGRLFAEMMALFHEGVLRPLPHRVFPASRIHEAFRYMQQSRQIGKVIVSFEDDAVKPIKPTFARPSSTALQLAQDGSYLVTGGLSGFGLQTARWLAEKGAGTLVLLSRSGATSDEAQQAVAELQAAGVQVAVYACDVADQAALQAVFADMQAKLPPLRGLVHAAMVLDDGIVRNMDAVSFRKVLAPKMLGAWHLHQLTAGMSLDFFALYSSVTTYLGNAGQGNYVAANLYLESLAHYRKAHGLPAVYAAWGPIADAGYLAQNTAVKEALQARLGGEALTTTRALSVLEQLLQGEQAGLAVIDFDWNTIQRVMPGAKSPKFSEQRRLAKSGEDGEQAEDIHALIAGLSMEAVHEVVAGLLIAEVGAILRLPREKLSVDKSVFDLGMDSLMGMELVLAIEERFGVRLPVMALTEGATVQRIAEKIAVHLLPADGEAAVVSAQELHQQSVAAVVKKHGSDMSALELDELARKLSAQADKEKT